MSMLPSSTSFIIILLVSPALHWVGVEIESQFGRNIIANGSFDQPSQRQGGRFPLGGFCRSVVRLPEVAKSKEGERLLIIPQMRQRLPSQFTGITRAHGGF